MNSKIASSKEKDIHNSTSDSRVIVLDEHGCDGSYIESEEGKKRLSELKELVNGKQFSGYVNPELTPINPADLHKKCLKWEDLPFEDDATVAQFVKLKGLLCTLLCTRINGKENVKFRYYTNASFKDFIFLDGSDSYAKQFFNNLMIEVPSNE